MNILITGIHGFVGSNLVAALKAQHTIYGLDIVSPQKSGVEQTFGWNELEKIPPVDAVIHLAGKAHDTQNTAAEQEYFDINLGLTRRIFEFILQSGATKFIFFSSVKAVADTVPGEYLTEEKTPTPGTPYGRSKLAAENYLLENNAQPATPSDQVNRAGSNKQPATSNPVRPGHPGGQRNSLFILRPCMIHGPGNKGNLNLLYRMVSKGIPWPLGAFENKRSFTTIDNLSFVISQIIEKEIEPGIYNMADDVPLSTNRLIELIAESKGKKAQIWNLSPKLITLAARAGDRLGLPLNSERLKKLTESYVVSNQKLKKALDIKNMPVSAEEGMKKTLESFK